VEVAIGVVVGYQHSRVRLFDALRTMRIADVSSQPGCFGTPINIVIRFPRVLAAAGETKRFEAHRLEGDVAREDHQVGPRDFAAVFLFDRPEEPACLVETDVVRPTVERRKPLLTPAAAATTVTRAIGSGAVPRHADEQSAVVAEVGRPPVL
jgi:hypothetical protein